MMGVITIMSTQNNSTRIFRVAKFPMGTFATRLANKSGSFEVCNQLSDFSRHILAKRASVDETLTSTCFRRRIIFRCRD